jgi:DNA polymerase III subunit delta
MTTTCYIFHGDDDLSIGEAVEKLRAGMGDDPNAELNTSEFDGADASVPEIINAVTSYPFLSERRLVIVRGLLGWLSRKGAGQSGKQGLQTLEEELPNLPEYSRLVLVERQTLPETNPILRLAGKLESGFVRHYAAPKDPTNWILKRARSEYGVEIDNRAAAALAAVTGGDLRRADNELVKLVSYVEDGQPISEMDVAALTPYVPEANIFKMVDAISEGNGDLALQLLHRLMSDKDQDPFSLYGMIIRQFRLLLLTKEHLASGGGPGGIAQAVGVRPFVAQSLAQQSRAFTLAQLERIYCSLQETDTRMKTGRIKPDLALDLFVASIAH